MLAKTIMNIFKSCDFEYSQMSGKPIKFDYLMLKDLIKWSGLKPKMYVSILNAMIRQYIRYIPDR